MSREISFVEEAFTVVAAAAYVAGGSAIVALVRAVTAAVILIFKQFEETQKIEERKKDGFITRNLKKLEDKTEEAFQPNQKKFWWEELKRAATEWIPIGGSIYWLYQDYKQTNDPSIKDSVKGFVSKTNSIAESVFSGTNALENPLNSAFLDINRCWYYFLMS